MAKKIFTAVELRKRTELSSKVGETYERVMTTLISLADNGATIAKVEIDRDISDAIVRKFIGDGFSAEYNPNYGKVTISWRDATCTATEEPVTENADETATKDECDTKRATQTCTAEDDSKEAHDATATEEPKANDKKQTVGIMRSVVFENCTFNVSIPISIPVDVHHNRVFNTRNTK